MKNEPLANSLARILPAQVWIFGFFVAVVGAIYWSPVGQYLTHGFYGHTSWSRVFGGVILAIFFFAMAAASATLHQKPRVFTHPNAIVTYHVVSGDPVEIDKKLADILTVNPNADLTKHQEALGITIVDVQRTPPKPETKTTNSTWI